MEFISAEQFLKQPKAVQKVFLNCWKPSNGDLYSLDECNYASLVKRFEDDCILNESSYMWIEKSKCIPLLTQGQLIQFIENHRYCIDIESYHDYQVTLNKRIGEGKLVIEKRISSTHLLDLIFEMALYVALEIAKEMKNNDVN